MRAHTDPRTRATPARSRNQAIRSGVGVRLRFLPPAARARARPHSYLHGFHKQGWGFARGNQNPANPTRRPRTNSFLAMQYTCIPAFRTDHHFFSVNLLVQNFAIDVVIAHAVDFVPTQRGRHRNLQVCEIRGVSGSTAFLYDGKRSRGHGKPRWRESSAIKLDFHLPCVAVPDGSLGSAENRFGKQIS